MRIQKHCIKKWRFYRQHFANYFKMNILVLPWYAQLFEYQPSQTCLVSQHFKQPQIADIRNNTPLQLCVGLKE